MKIAVQKNHLEDQIVVQKIGPFKKDEMHKF